MEGQKELTKAVILGWMRDLEKWEKPKGRRRKTILYWKKLLREAGVDWTDINSITKDRKKWKRTVKERMKKVDKWEKGKGHHWAGEIMERNEQRIVMVDFICENAWESNMASENDARHDIGFS